MSVTTSATVLGTAAADVAVQRRNISMKDFRSVAVNAQAVKDQVTVAAGQVVGVVYSVQAKQGTLPDGTVRTNLVAIGRFEGVVYESGEVISASQFYAPGYYMTTLQGMLEAGAKANAVGVTIAVEICCEPTGLDPKTGMAKNPAYAWVVKDLASMQMNDPLAAIKRSLQARDMLRLPPPVDGTAAMIGSDVTAEETSAAADPTPATTAAAEEAGKGRKR